MKQKTAGVGDCRDNQRCSQEVVDPSMTVMTNTVDRPLVNFVALRRVAPASPQCSLVEWADRALDRSPKVSGANNVRNGSKADVGRTRGNVRF